jgi:AcrR family transcriptional regulator
LTAASLGLIAREAGTSKPAVLYHFGSRENLLHEMTQRALSELQRVFLEIARHAKHDARAQVTLDGAFAKENRVMLSAARELMTLGGRDGVVSDLVRRAFEEVEQGVAELLPEGMQDPAQTASDIVRSVFGFLSLWLCHQDVDPGVFQAGALRASLRLGVLGS